MSYQRIACLSTEAVPAVLGDQLHEIKSADILSPGPGAITEGLAQLERLVLQWAHDDAI